MGFDKNEAKSIREAQELLQKESLKSDLAYVEANLSFLPVSIKLLEAHGLTLHRSLEILEDAEQKLNSIPGSTGKIFQDRLANVLRKNPSLNFVKQVSRVLQGGKGNLPEGLSPSLAAALKFCPMASADVERSFSNYNNLLSDRRHSLTEENLTKMLICNFFYARH